MPLARLPFLARAWRLSLRPVANANQGGPGCLADPEPFHSRMAQKTERLAFPHEAAREADLAYEHRESCRYQNECPLKGCGRGRALSALCQLLEVLEFRIAPTGD